MATIAVLGTGHMGAAIARRLLASGHVVTVWNRTASRTTPVVAAGARASASPADAVADAEVVISMLTDARAVDAVLFGPGGAARALRPVTCVVQMSTVGPDEVRHLARRLPDGVDLVDAPVAGSVAAAEAGTLLLLAAGERDALARVTPILKALGTVRECGRAGDGAALKLVLNTALVTGVAALADTLAVADAVGVDRDTAIEALRAGPLGGAVQRATATGARFSFALAAKDIDLALRELGGTPAPIAHATARALRAVPHQTADIATIISREQQCN
jgi:3-hydroxyisobutyrate dehydrogenase